MCIRDRLDDEVTASVILICVHVILSSETDNINLTFPFPDVYKRQGADSTLKYRNRKMPVSFQSLSRPRLPPMKSSNRTAF